MLSTSIVCRVCCCSHGDIGDSAAPDVGASLQLITDIQQVRLSQNRLTHRGLKQIAAHLHTSALVVLDVGFNDLGQRGAVVLAAIMEVVNAFLVMVVCVRVYCTTRYLSFGPIEKIFMLSVTLACARRTGVAARVERRRLER